MTWTHGVLEAFENRGTYIFKSRVTVSVVENAMAKGTTIEVDVVVKTRGQREMMQAQAIKVVANTAMVVAVTHAIKVVANMAMVVEVTHANMVECQYLTN